MAQFTKYTGNVQGVAGSLITALDAALVTGQSWTTGTNGNRSWYRPPSGNQLYLAVDDSGVVTAKEARITGFEQQPTITASPITGTNPFPTAAQNAAGNGVACMIARKSYSADATNRAYIIYADARTVYCFILTTDAGGTGTIYCAWMFGEFYSILSSADAWNTMIVGRTVENSGTITNDKLDVITSSVNATTAGHYIARAYNGLPASNGSYLATVTGDQAKTASSNLLIGAAGSVAYPNSPDGGLYLSPVWVSENGGTNANVMRGRMRGLWQVCHATTPFGHGDTFSGTGDLAGRTFELIKPSGNSALYCIETSNTLETN